MKRGVFALNPLSLWSNHCQKACAKIHYASPHFWCARLEELEVIVESLEWVDGWSESSEG